jgi:hydrogenase expression/formation protein HypE
MRPKDANGNIGLQCPIPLRDYPEIVMAHGAGGALTKELIDKMFAPIFDNAWLAQDHDGAVFTTEATRLAFTTDSYVVKPLIFPGGDIGTLAVCGTVNDLAMCGARPSHLSLGLIIEEGLAMDTLWQIIRSIGNICRHAGVQIVTGDTKVVDRGKGDGLFINMSGVGEVLANTLVAPRSIKARDVILLSGDVGRHGVAILSAREGLAFETEIKSDCAPLHEMVIGLIEAGLEIHCLRDLTRGGLATALIEISGGSGLGMAIDENKIPIGRAVRGATEILGLDPLYVANEGRFVVILPEKQAASALEILRSFPNGAQACRIGTVTTSASPVTIENTYGVKRQLDLLTGELLPRIC